MGERRSNPNSSVCAIITTFDPDPGLPDLVAEIAQQVRSVYLVNDSGSRDVRASLDSAFSGEPGLRVLHMEKNSGVAAALNRGIHEAAAAGFSKAILLDDDTSVSERIVEDVMLVWGCLEGAGWRPGVIGVSRKDRHSPAFDKAAEVPRKTWWSVRGVITAGSFIDIRSAIAVGGFREEFFIDAVDYEFCERIRRRGLLVARLSSKLITHSVGHAEARKLFGVRFRSTNHSPLRRYYMYRNNAVFAKEQLTRDPLLSLAIVWFLVKTALLIAFVETERPRKCKACLIGLIDGLRGQKGRAERVL